MKRWKYIKGSEKDFEGAPDWATIRTFTGGCAFFAEGHTKGLRVYDIARKSNFIIKDEIDISSITTIAQRELIEVWNGEGLPPVGTVCQWDNGNSDWSTVTVLGINGDDVWVKPDNGSQSFVVSDNDFRPLPDERSKVIDDLVYVFINGNPKGAESYINLATAMYNTGWRNYSAKPGFEWRYVCSTCGCKVEPGEELPHGC